PRARASRADPVPCRLRRSVPGLREGSERRAARARGARGGSPLGGARRAPRPFVVAGAGICLRRFLPRKSPEVRPLARPHLHVFHLAEALTRRSAPARGGSRRRRLGRDPPTGTPSR